MQAEDNVTDDVKEVRTLCLDNIPWDPPEIGSLVFELSVKQLKQTLLVSQDPCSSLCGIMTQESGGEVGVQRK